MKNDEDNWKTYTDIVSRFYNASSLCCVHNSIGRGTMCFSGCKVDIDTEGYFYINGGAVIRDSFYTEYEKGDLDYPYTVREGSAFILQDYRPYVNDSRLFGAIPVEDILGKVIFVSRLRDI